MEPFLGCLGPQTPIPHLFSFLHSPSVPSHLFFTLSLLPNYAYWSHFPRSSAPRRMDPEHQIILGLHLNKHEDQQGTNVPSSPTLVRQFDNGLYASLQIDYTGVSTLPLSLGHKPKPMAKASMIVQRNVEEIIKTDKVSDLIRVCSIYARQNVKQI